MRKFIMTMAVSLALPAAAAAQEQLSPEEEAINQLVNQYATVTLGYRINQRCNQLYPKAAEVFGENQKILDTFMSDFLTDEAYQRLNAGLLEAGNDEVANPCGPETFDFVQASAQIASTMAYRVQVLNGVEEPETAAVPPPVPAAAEQPQQAEPQPEPQPVMEPEPEAMPETQPAAEPEMATETEPEMATEAEPEMATEAEPEMATEAEPEMAPQEAVMQPVQQPEPEPAMEPSPEPEPAMEPSPEPEPAVQPEPMASEPEPEPAPAALPMGESKKEMKARQREEILTLRRAQRVELEAFKERENSYPDPKAAKKVLEDRHEAEFDEMRERHYREQQENKG